MARVIDVAQKFFDDLGSIGAMRQQKLSYFVQAWTLVWTGKPMFSEEIQAWPNGPVTYDLWRDNSYGKTDLCHIRGADAARLDEDEARMLHAVVAFYNPFPTDALRELSHDEPWLEVREGLAPDERSNREIPITSIARYYARQAILNPNVPKKPALRQPEPAPESLVLEASLHQMSIWEGTLDRLAKA